MLFALSLQAVNMVRRECRDCPISACGAKYLVRLANHLADVYLLEFIERRKYLQEAKLQPKIKFIGYGSKKDEKNCHKNRRVRRGYTNCHSQDSTKWGKQDQSQDQSKTE